MDRGFNNKDKTVAYKIIVGAPRTVFQDLRWHPNSNPNWPSSYGQFCQVRTNPSGAK